MEIVTGSEATSHRSYPGNGQYKATREGSGQERNTANDTEPARDINRDCDENTVTRSPAP
jgi:hypothetical protein